MVETLAALGHGASTTPLQPDDVSHEYLHYCCAKCGRHARMGAGLTFFTLSGDALGIPCGPRIGLVEDDNFLLGATDAPTEEI